MTTTPGASLPSLPLPALFAAALLAAFAGCTPDSAERETRDANLPEIQKAIEFEREGQFDKAIEQYETALQIHPASALAHLNVGLLLHDSAKDYVSAIYHYRRYLAMNPSAQKRQLVEDRLRQARQLLAAELTHDLAKAGDAGIYIQQLQAERRRSAELEGARNTLAQELAETKSALQLKETEILRLKRRVEVLSAPPASAEIAVGNAGRIRAATQGTGDPGVRTYVVRQGESLSHIAEKVYGNPAEWIRIRNANRDVVIGEDRVKAGMELIIP